MRCESKQCPRLDCLATAKQVLPGHCCPTCTGMSSVFVYIFKTWYVFNESMVSFVSRCYMRVVNGSLMVCLAYSNRKTKCQNYRKISQN